MGHSFPFPATRDKTSSNRLVNRLYIGLGVILLIPIVTHAYVGWFSRYMADDYCTVGVLGDSGFTQSQVYWYTRWSGRFAFTFFVNVAELIGPGVVRFLPAAVILLWLAALVFLFRRALYSLGSRPGTGTVLSLAAVVLLGTLWGAPNIYQSLYWQTGLLTYVVPLVLFSGYLGWLLLRHPRQQPGRTGWALIAVSAATAFLIGGFSETNLSLQTLALLMLLTMSVYQARRKSGAINRWLIVAGLVGSLAAAIVIIAAPGNNVRQGLMPPPSGLVDWLGRTAWDVLLFANRGLQGLTLTTALVIAVPFLLALFPAIEEVRRSQGKTEELHQWGKQALLIPLLTALLMFATIAPYEYIVSTYPDGRVLVTTQFVLVAGLAAWGYAVGKLSRAVLPLSPIAKPGVYAAIWLVALVPISVGVRKASLQAIEPLADAQEFALTWDQRDHTIKQAVEQGEQAMAVRSLNHMGGLAEIGRDPDEWINRCVAQSYGLKRVVAK